MGLVGNYFGIDVWPKISKPTPFTYLGSDNWDPFIYLPFKIATYTYTSMGHRIASREE